MLPVKYHALADLHFNVLSPCPELYSVLLIRACICVQARPPILYVVRSLCLAPAKSSVETRIIGS